MTMYRDRSYSTARVTNTSTGIICPCVSGGDYAIVNLLWTVPDKYRGKKVTFHWYIHHNGNNTEYDKEITGIADVTFPIPSAPAEVKPILMDPIISYDASHANQIMVPYMMAASNVEKIRAIYVDGQRIAFPIELDKNNRLSFSRVIQCGRKDADKLYELLDDWFTKTFSDKLDGKTDPEGIRTDALIDNDWMASIQLSVTFDFKERCIECHNQKNQMRK